MKNIFFIKTLILCLSFTLNASPNEQTKDSISVYVFLHESCLISQYYTLPLKTLYQEYANEAISFVGVFPNRSSRLDNMEAFKTKYQIPFELKTDYDHTITEKFEATVTPEVVVYNETQEEVIYKGRIDDAYARVGKRKQVTTTSELQKVLEALTNDQSVLVSNTQAVGCFINKKELKK